MANADTLNDLKSLARFMRGVQDVVAILETAGGMDQVVAEAEARVRDVKALESQTKDQLAAVMVRAEEARAELEDLKGQKPAFLERLKGDAQAITAKAEADAQAILDQGKRQAAEILAGVQAERDRLIGENVDRRKTGAVIEAENNAKREELAAINAQIDAARRAISGLIGDFVAPVKAKPVEAKPVEPTPAPAPEPAPTPEPEPAAAPQADTAPAS